MARQKDYESIRLCLFVGIIFFLSFRLDIDLDFDLMKHFLSKSKKEKKKKSKNLNSTWVSLLPTKYSPINLAPVESKSDTLQYFLYHLVRFS